MEAAELPAIPPAHLERATSRLYLGAILVRDGRLTVKQLDEALSEQADSGRRLGELLIERDWVSARTVAEALAEQHDLEFLDLSHTDVQPEAAALLSEKHARRYQALPIRCISNDLVLVAVADPTNVMTSDDLRLALGRNVRLAVVTVADLDELISRVYRSPVEVDESEFESVELDAAPDDIRDLATSAPAIKLVNSLLIRAIDDGASDVHFEPQVDNLVVRIRIDGAMRRLVVLPKTMQAAVTSRLKVMSDLDIAERRTPQDGRASIRFGGEPMDLRVAILPTTYGEQVVIRILRRAATGLSLAGLGMSPDAEAAFLRSIRQPFGAVIVCGPTGSGKTTTLYAALNVLNEEHRAVMTIEDPVEHQIPGITQIEVTPRSGLTFPRGLRTILRSDPDVLLIGEIRDEETARIAIQAAMTGHLVLTTLHTHNAASSVARLKDMSVEPSLLATSINCIVAQRLARRLCENCREPYEAPPAELSELGLEPGAEELELYRAEGCVQCGGTGYRGRVALYEVMPVQGKLRRLIEGSTEEIFAAAVEQGMTTLRQEGLRLCREGLCSIDEIRRVTGDRLV